MIRAFIIATALASLSLCIHPAGAQTVYGPPITSQRLCTVFTSVGNGADLTEDTLQTCSIPANTLVNAGDVIAITASGPLGATTDVKTIKFKVGGINLINLNATLTVSVKWSGTLYIMKSGPSTQRAAGTGLAHGGSVVVGNGATALTDTSAIPVLITGQNATNPVAGSVTCDYVTIQYFPATL